MTKFPWLFSYLRIAPGPELSRKAWIQIGKSSDLAADRFRWTVQSDCSLGRSRPPVPFVAKIFVRTAHITFNLVRIIKWTIRIVHS